MLLYTHKTHKHINTQTQTQKNLFFFFIQTQTDNTQNTYPKTQRNKTKRIWETLFLTPHPSRQAATPSPKGEGYSENKHNINAQKINNIESFLKRARERLFSKSFSRTIFAKTFKTKRHFFKCLFNI